MIGNGAPRTGKARWLRLAEEVPARHDGMGRTSRAEQPCAYRKLKPAHNGDEAHQGLGAN